MSIPTEKNHTIPCAPGFYLIEVTEFVGDNGEPAFNIEGFEGYYISKTPIVGWNVRAIFDKRDNGDEYVGSITEPISVTLDDCDYIDLDKDTTAIQNPDGTVCIKGGMWFDNLRQYLEWCTKNRGDRIINKI